MIESESLATAAGCPLYICVFTKVFAHRASLRPIVPTEISERSLPFLSPNQPGTALALLTPMVSGFVGCPTEKLLHKMGTHQREIAIPPVHLPSPWPDDLTVIMWVVWPQ